MYELRKKIDHVGYITFQIVSNYRLPTIKQVLAVLFYNMRRFKNSLDVSARLAINECFIFWEKARIPTQELHKCVEKLKLEYARWRNLTKNASRKSDTQKKNEAAYEESINKLFDIAKKNALEEMQDEEDKEFLRSQRGLPKTSGTTICDNAVLEQSLPMEIDEKTKTENVQPLILSKDQVVCVTEDFQAVNPTVSPFNTENLSPMEVDNENLKVESNEPMTTSDNHDVRVLRKLRPVNRDDTVTKEELDELIGPQSQSQPSQHTPPVKRRATEIFMTPKLGTVLDKCKISKNNAMHLLMAAAEAFKVDTKNLILNTKSIHETRKQFRQERYEAIKLLAPSLFSNLPTTIHWDGKLLPGILRGEKNDRLAVIITSEGMEQLLGIPKIDSSSGKNQAQAVYEALIDWSMLQNIEALCCDSTASNTGSIKGACPRLEQLLGKNLLYFICRHHIYELVLRCVFEVKFGKTTGPDVQQFKKFEDFWRVAEKRSFDNGIADSYVNESLKDDRDAILDFCLEYLKRDHFRKDYKEFLELVIIFLGGKLPDGVVFHPPGPVHHARWMAKAIYSLKIFIFRKNFLLDNKEDELKYRDVCIFIIKVYVKAWFCAASAAQAPNQDLEFLKQLYDYSSVDKGVSDAAVKKFQNHLWYLTPEITALSFFDSKVSDEEKLKMCEALKSDCSTFAYKKRIIANKKNMPEIVKSSLSDFICKDTNEFFKRFKIDNSFLSKHPSKWSKDRNYIYGVKIVQNIKAVNDVAEREVKLITEFNNLLTKDEQQTQYLLPVIKEYRKLYLNSNKEMLMKPYV